MALRKSFEGQEANATEKAPIEGTVETKTVEAAPASEQPAAVAAAEAPAAAAANDEVKSTAVAAAPKLGLALGGKFKPALQELQNVIDPHALDFDTFPRVTVGLDGFSDDKDKDLGKVIRLQIMSWNERYIVTAGEDNDEANALTAYSLDGKVIDSTGQSTADYLAYLKDTEGYKDAAIKKYYTLYGFLVEANDKEIDAEDRNIVAIQIPPRSVSKFSAYQIERGVKEAQGLVQPSDMLYLCQEKQRGKTKSYASIAFSAKKPA